MSRTIFNQSKIDFTKQPMFFGENQNVQRFDTYKYPVFDKLTQTQLGYFWRPEEISLQKDRSDFAQFRPEQKHIFTANLKYQTLLDSVQGRGPVIAFLPYCSLPELESCIVTWDFFETIHSRSYTHIIKNVYPNPTDVLDKIVDDKEILKRATSVTKHYDDFIEYAKQWDVNGKGSTRVLKKKLYLAMANVNILEGLRFYVSFACTFAFGELKLMEGSAKILSLIARDESQHLAITTHIIKNWMNGDDKEIKPLIKECQDDIIKMWKNCVNEEKQWCNYLFKDGSMLGLNKEILCQYVEYITDVRVKAIGIDPIFNVTKNPIPWMKTWLASDTVQVAPQEVEISSYLVGQVDSEVNVEDLGDFEL